MFFRMHNSYYNVICLADPLVKTQEWYDRMKTRKSFYCFSF